MKYKLQLDGLNDKLYRDEVVAEHFLPLFSKRGMSNVIDALVNEVNSQS